MMDQANERSKHRSARWAVSLLLTGLLGALGAACDDDGSGSTPPDIDGETVIVPSDELSARESAILAVHNTYRASSVTPTPSPDLPAMSWDRELARVAQAYADKCVWGHNGSRTEQYRGDGYIGENLSATSGQTSEIDAAELSRLVKLWTDEDVDYDYASNSCAAGKVCGHYTQVVWRNTTRVGCGWAQCETLENLSSWRSPLILVCNYAPGGNYVGQRPY